jgi:hypothetical protein
MRLSALLFAVLAVSCGNPSSNPLDFATEIAGRYCDQQISCNLVAKSHRGDCVQSLRNVLGVRSNEADRGLLKLNSPLANKCLSEFKTTGCTRDGLTLGGACLAAIEPAAAAGGKCENDSHCRDPQTACIGSGCERTCQAAGAAGQACRPGLNGAGTCNAGLICDASGKCSRGGATGADCSSTPCDPDNFCDQATRMCAALPTAGSTCRPAVPQCAESAICLLNVCTAKTAAGGACITTAQCTAGTSCRAGTCQALVAEGGTCAVTADCATGLACDSVSLICQRAKRAFFEESCSSTAICAGNLACRNLKLGRAGAAGTPGTCGLAAVGDSCFSAASCPPGSFCEPNMTAGEPGSCKASSSGAMCTVDSECLESEACHTLDHKCVARVTTGGNCSNAACVSNATCVRRGGTRVCVEPADLGKTCNADMVEISPCRSPLLCARTTCISAGRKGEPCLNGTTCTYGACRDGICDDPRPDGATCKSDPDCRTGACEAGICVQVCR